MEHQKTKFVSPEDLLEKEKFNEEHAKLHKEIVEYRKRFLKTEDGKKIEKQEGQPIASLIIDNSYLIQMIANQRNIITYLTQKFNVLNERVNQLDNRNDLPSVE